MIFRVARHTQNLEPIIHFYCTILNFNILGSFKNHSNYNGVFLGKPNSNWHLEFTTSNSNAKHIFDEDDILVFYPKTLTEYQNITTNINTHQIKIHQAKNPYWNENGILIKDPDGYHIIISNLKINTQP